MRKNIKILLIGLLLPLLLQAQTKHEVRAVWLTSLYNLDWPSTLATDGRSMDRQKKELCAILDQLVAAHFNTVIFQTRLRGDVVYPSAMEPYAECLTGTAGRAPGYDPLQFAIDECHKRNMELHAWVVAIPLGSASETKKQGRQAVAHRQAHLCKRYKGRWYMNPGHPDTKYYLSRLAMEIVDHYDIDGIHLDYIRYPEQAPDFPDDDTYRRYGKGQDKALWRRNNITEIVRCVYQNVKTKKPWVKVSASPVGKYSDTRRYDSRGWNALHAVHQDAQLWMKEGICDVLFPMMYFKNNHFFPFALDWNENKQGRLIVPGLGVYFLDPNEGNWKTDEVMQQMKFIRDHKMDGMAFFRNRYVMNNTQGLMSETTRSFFAHPALVPPMVWMDSIAPSSPRITAIEETDSTVCLKWHASTSNDTTPVRYRIYASGQYPVDTDDARNIVCTGTADTTLTIALDHHRRYRLYWAVAAADRYGNESPASAFNGGRHPWQSIATSIHIDEGCVMVISTLAGREVMRLTAHREDRLELLPQGIYRIASIDADGHRTDRGVYVR